METGSSLAGIYLFKVSNGNTRTVCEICSKLTIRNQNDVIDAGLVHLDRQIWIDSAHCSVVSIVEFEQVNARWEKRLRQVQLIESFPYCEKIFQKIKNF